MEADQQLLVSGLGRFQNLRELVLVLDVVGQSLAGLQTGQEPHCRAVVAGRDQQVVESGLNEVDLLDQRVLVILADVLAEFLHKEWHEDLADPAVEDHCVAGAQFYQIILHA